MPVDGLSRKLPDNSLRLKIMSNSNILRHERRQEGCCVIVGYGATQFIKLSFYPEFIQY